MFGVRMAVDTGIDEFFDERLQRVLGTVPSPIEAGSQEQAATCAQRSPNDREALKAQDDCDPQD